MLEAVAVENNFDIFLIYYYRNRKRMELSYTNVKKIAKRKRKCLLVKVNFVYGLQPSSLRVVPEKKQLNELKQNFAILEEV